MPLGDETDIVREITVSHVPEEPLQVFAVIDGAEAFAFGDLGEEKVLTREFRDLLAGELMIDIAIVIVRDPVHLYHAQVVCLNLSPMFFR
jgi:hypothetical protein